MRPIQPKGRERDNFAEVSARYEVVSRGRPRRHRAKALLLTSLGWIVCAAPATFFASGSWLGPLGVLVTGSTLLLVCARAEGDLPFAAIGVGAIGAFAMALATVGIVGGVPVALLGCLVVGAALSAAVIRALGSTSPATGRFGGMSALAAAAVIALLAVLSFPGRERFELAVFELAPGEASSAGAAHTEAGEGPAPAALSRAPTYVADGEAPDVARAGPRLRTATRHVAPTQHRVAIWLVGLFLVGVGSLAVLVALARLRDLRGALHARRTAHGYVLDDGEPVELEPPSTAARVVVRARRGGGYRAIAVQRVQLLGEGELTRLVGVLRGRALVIALGTLVATAAAWLPLIALG